MPSASPPIPCFTIAAPSSPQFHPLKCFSNFYFACIGAMQMIKIISITRGMPNQWLPLILIVGA